MIYRSSFGRDVRGPRWRWADLSDILPANQRASYIDVRKTIENDGMDIVNKYQLTIGIVLISFPSLITAISPSTGKSSFAAKKSIRFSSELFLNLRYSRNLEFPRLLLSFWLTVHSSGFLGLSAIEYVNTRVKTLVKWTLSLLKSLNDIIF